MEKIEPDALHGVLVQVHRLLRTLMQPPSTTKKPANRAVLPDLLDMVIISYVSNCNISFRQICKGDVPSEVQHVYERMLLRIQPSSLSSKISRNLSYLDDLGFVRRIREGRELIIKPGRRTLDLLRACENDVIVTQGDLLLHPSMFAATGFCDDIHKVANLIETRARMETDPIRQEVYLAMAVDSYRRIPSLDCCCPPEGLLHEDAESGTQRCVNLLIYNVNKHDHLFPIFNWEGSKGYLHLHDRPPIDVMDSTEKYPKHTFTLEDGNLENFIKDISPAISKRYPADYRGVSS